MRGVYQCPSNILHSRDHEGLLMRPLKCGKALGVHRVFATVLRNYCTLEAMSLSVGGVHCHGALSKVKQQQSPLHLTCNFSKDEVFVRSPLRPSLLDSRLPRMAPLLPFLYLQCPKVCRIYERAPQGVIWAAKYDCNSAEVNG